MSVLIKGMEMPKKELILILFPDGKVATEEYEIGAKAKAVEVPPHGRLIDADALPYLDIEWEDIVNAPTVIETEEG